MVTFVTLLWSPNHHSLPFSTMYDETWVEKLYRGIQRNLRDEFDFVLFTDRERHFRLPQYSIKQEQIKSQPPTYAACIEPYRLGVPMVLMGLDTVITGNIDHLAEYCLTGTQIAVPRDPYHPDTVCNGVALVPSGHRHVYDRWRGENDMEWIRAQNVEIIGDIWPGHVVSYKGQVEKNGVGDARIVYFHGARKPHEIHEPWLKEAWA